MGKNTSDMSGIKDWNPLFCSPSPRDIPEVMECHRRLPFDRLYAKYFVEREAYWHLRRFFLSHPEYTHLVLIPDDLVFKMSDVEQLYRDLREYDYAILSGICNVDLGPNRDKWSITENLPHPIRPLKKVDNPQGNRRWFGWRWYSWYTNESIRDEQKRQNREIFRVQHSGFALQSIRRDIVERVEFITDAVENGIPESETSSVDIMFSNLCGAAGFAIFVDPRIRMLHMRQAGPVEITLGNAELWHIKPDGTKKVFLPPSPVPKRTHSIFD